MDLWKYYLHTLVIEKEEWGHLSNPTSLALYWEPSQESGDFHRTFALVLCRSTFHDCKDSSQRKEFVVSVAVFRKQARYEAIPFSTAANAFWEEADASPTLLLVCLHRKSWLFPDIYFNQSKQHFTVMHNSGGPYSVGHPQRFTGALLHNAYRSRDTPSQKANLPLAFLDNQGKFPIDSCIC